VSWASTHTRRSKCTHSKSAARTCTQQVCLQVHACSSACMRTHTVLCECARNPACTHTHQDVCWVRGKVVQLHSPPVAAGREGGAAHEVHGRRSASGGRRQGLRGGGLSVCVTGQSIWSVLRVERHACRLPAQGWHLIRTHSHTHAHTQRAHTLSACTPAGCCVRGGGT